MSLFVILTILLVAAALFSFVNHRFIHLPQTIGVMILALVASVLVLIAGKFLPGIQRWAMDLSGHIQFSDVVLHGMLAFLLFAGSLHLDLAALREDKWAIGLLSILGTVISTFIVGGLSYAIFNAVGLTLPFMPCVLFGALISPTDPIAVLAIMRGVNAPRRLEMQLAGESLFNDGMGVVLFLVLLATMASGQPPNAWNILAMLTMQTGGAIALGLACGFIAYYLLGQVDDYQVEILLTLGLCTGVFALGDMLHVSGPIAEVVAGLFIGSRGRSHAMSPRTREHLDTFWELIDSILNAVLFLLLGLQILLLPLDTRILFAAILSIPVVLAARFFSVAAVVAPLRFLQHIPRGTLRVMTWGGLRGGLSVAMALSIPSLPYKPELLAVTFGVVVFSIIVQGITVGPVIRRLYKLPAAE